MSTEGDLDQCVKAHMIVYIVLQLCVDVEGTHRTMKLACLVLGMADEMHPISYHERWGGLSPPRTPKLVRGGSMPPQPPLQCTPISHLRYLQKCVGAGSVINNRC